MQALHADCFAPFDLALGQAFNILDDTQYRIVLRIALSGLVGVLWSAPPCKEYTRLKLRKPGTPDHMDGVPGLSAEEQDRVNASREIPARSRRVIRRVREASGEAGFEQPPSSMAWLEPDNITLLGELCARVAQIAACNHQMDYYKSWAFCASFASIATA